MSLQNFNDHLDLRWRWRWKPGLVCVLPPCPARRASFAAHPRDGRIPSYNVCDDVNIKNLLTLVHICNDGDYGDDNDANFDKKKPLLLLLHVCNCRKCSDQIDLLLPHHVGNLAQVWMRTQQYLLRKKTIKYSPSFVLSCSAFPALFVSWTESDTVQPVFLSSINKSKDTFRELTHQIIPTCGFCMSCQVRHLKFCSANLTDGDIQKCKC